MLMFVHAHALRHPSVFVTFAATSSPVTISACRAVGHLQDFACGDRATMNAGAMEGWPFPSDFRDPSEAWDLQNKLMFFALYTGFWSCVVLAVFLYTWLRAAAAAADESVRQWSSKAADSASALIVPVITTAIASLM